MPLIAASTSSSAYQPLRPYWARMLQRCPTDKLFIDVFAAFFRFLCASKGPAICVVAITPASVTRPRQQSRNFFIVYPFLYRRNQSDGSCGTLFSLTSI